MKNSPFIEVDLFMDYLGKQAKRFYREQPEWRVWMQDRTERFWTEMSTLKEEGKCIFIVEGAREKIYLPHISPTLLENVFLDTDSAGTQPFPSEESLGFTLPEDQVKNLNSEEDIFACLDEPVDPDTPILKIHFPMGFGSALVPAGVLPRLITDTAILKIRNYLRKQGNKEFVFRKLVPQLQNRESYIHSQINQIIQRPAECFNSIEEGSEVSYMFWANLSILIKNDIKERNDLISDDIAAFQAAYIIETINGYFRSLEAKNHAREMAFKTLEEYFEKPPYLYSLEQILKLRSPTGLLLSKLYSNENLESWLRRKTTERKQNQLPDLLVVQAFANERSFLLKDKMLLLCSRLLFEARTKVKDDIKRHWRELLLDYRSEPAMESDEEFEKLLALFTERLSPTLSYMLKDPKLYLVYEEMGKRKEVIAALGKIFSKGKILPYSALYSVKRKDLLSDIKLFLPFWYSIPIIASIIAFFRSLGGGKPPPKSTSPEATDESPEERLVTGGSSAAFEEIKRALIPPGHTLDSYLEELEGRWCRVIDKKARENLIADVQSLLRNQLRRNVKIQKRAKPSRELLNEIAATVFRTPALVHLGNRDAFIQYGELYLIKLMESGR